MDIKELIEDFLNETDKKYLEKNPFFKMDSVIIYNEFSLQFELGFYLRDKGYKVYFEKNIKDFVGDYFENKMRNDVIEKFNQGQKNGSIKKQRKLDTYVEEEKDRYIEKQTNDFVKHEMDLYVISKDREASVIELKFPTNGAYPRRMFQCVTDLKFMEQTKDLLSSLTDDQSKTVKTYCLTIVNDDNIGKNYREADEVLDDTIYQFFRNSSNKPKLFPKSINGKIKNPIEKTEDITIAKGPYPKIEWKQTKGKKFWYYILEAK